jgi:aryl-alcohol dehydrogenase-like predicted oxidoreductase
MVALGLTDFDAFGICLGGNVFGWTADEPQSHAILDAYTGAGGNFIDTANSYLVEHGRSETIIGRWLTITDADRERAMRCLDDGDLSLVEIIDADKASRSSS